MEVEVLAVAFLAREHLVRLVEYPLHPLRKEGVLVEVLVLRWLCTRVVPAVVFLKHDTRLLVKFMKCSFTYIDLVEFAVEIVPDTWHLLLLGLTCACQLLLL